jgi:transposase-like protein
VERRRRFSVEQKVAVLAEATAPGANMSEVARRHGLLPAQVYKWRRLAELGIIGMRAPQNCRRLWPSRSPVIAGIGSRRRAGRDQ